MQRDSDWERKQFQHEPARPAREGLVGENVFRDKWATLMADFGDMDYPCNWALSQVMGNSFGYKLTQRTATVAAGFITWLGTNMGNHYLSHAKELAKWSTGGADAYLMAWAEANVRRSAVNGGRRTIEMFLPPQKNARLNIADVEAVECVASWLGSEEGQIFLADCEAEIARRTQEATFKHFLTVNAGMTPSMVEQTLRMAAEYQPAEMT